MTSDEPAPARTPVTFWVAVGAIVVGVIFVCCPYRVSVLAPILVSLGLGVLTYSTLAGPRPLPRVLAAIGVVAVVLSLGGLAVRLFDGNNHRQFYGDRVTITVDSPGECEFTEGRRGRGGSNANCAGATWTAGGEQHTGTVAVDGKDIAGSTGAVTLDGYAIGDEASSATRTDPEYDAARISGVPLWVGLAGLILILAGALTRRVVRSP